MKNALCCAAFNYSADCFCSVVCVASLCCLWWLLCYPVVPAIFSQLDPKLLACADLLVICSHQICSHLLQVIIIVNTLVYLVLSFVTVPLYSLGVQMGSDFRPHIFSPDVKNRLLEIAGANKEKASLALSFNI